METCSPNPIPSCSQSALPHPETPPPLYALISLPAPGIPLSRAYFAPLFSWICLNCSCSSDNVEARHPGNVPSFQHKALVCFATVLLCSLQLGGGQEGGHSMPPAQYLYPFEMAEASCSLTALTYWIVLWLKTAIGLQSMWTVSFLWLLACILNQSGTLTLSLTQPVVTEFFYFWSSRHELNILAL